MRFHQVLASPLMDVQALKMAVQIQDLLTGLGETFIYGSSAYSHSQVQPFDALIDVENPSSEDLIIFHASIGNAHITDTVIARPERLIVIFHGVPDAERFFTFDPVIGGLVKSGPLELAAMAEKAEIAITFGGLASTLQDAGFSHIEIVDPIFDADALLSIPPFAPTLNHFANAVDGPVIVFNAQVLPHRRVEFLLKSYHLLITHLLPEANLIILGEAPLPKYTQYLDDFMKGLNLHKAALFGLVPDEELVAIYRSADLVVSLENDENPIAPLLEALAFEIPAVAGESSSNHGVNGGAVIVPADANEMLMAEAMFEALTNQALRAELVEQGRKVVSQFDADVSSAQLLERILSVRPR